MNASSDDYVPRSALTGDSAPGDSVATTLAERNKTHGDFTDNAAVMQATKNLWRSTRNWHTGLTSVQREALDMIAHKVGRILTGNPNEKDHWHDIAGYAKLSEDRCK